MNYKVCVCVWGGGSSCHKKHHCFEKKMCMCIFSRCVINPRVRAYAYSGPID